MLIFIVAFISLRNSEPQGEQKKHVDSIVDQEDMLLHYEKFKEMEMAERVLKT